MNKATIKILFTGDFCPHKRIEKLAFEDKYSQVFGKFQNEFKGNDLNVVDLECPLTTETQGISKSGPHQKAHPKTINLLQKMHIGMVAMANNHILDYGGKALINTIDLCKKNNIETIGVGKNVDEARQPVIKIIANKKIGFLNFAESEWTIAGKDSPGANSMELINSYTSIQSLKQKVDKVIVIAHGGIEHYHLPSPRIKKTYRFFVDAGADAIISHHTHCLTGYEMYRNAPIFYGLGNFLYDWEDKKDENWNFGYMVRLFIDNQIEFEIIPLKQNNGDEVGVHYLTEEENKSFQKKLAELNTIIADDNQLEEEFKKLCKRQENIYKLYFEPYRGKIISGLRVRKWLPELFSKKKKLAQLNIVRCESHRDIFMEVMKNDLKKY